VFFDFALGPIPILFRRPDRAAALGPILVGELGDGLLLHGIVLTGRPEGRRLIFFRGVLGHSMGRAATAVSMVKTLGRAPMLRRFWALFGRAASGSKPSASNYFVLGEAPVNFAVLQTTLLRGIGRAEVNWRVTEG